MRCYNTNSYLLFLSFFPFKLSHSWNKHLLVSNKCQYSNEIHLAFATTQILVFFFLPSFSLFKLSYAWNKHLPNKCVSIYFLKLIFDLTDRCKFLLTWVEYSSLTKDINNIATSVTHHLVYYLNYISVYRSIIIM